MNNLKYTSEKIRDIEGQLKSTAWAWANLKNGPQYIEANKAIFKYVRKLGFKRRKRKTWKYTQETSYQFKKFFP